MENLSEFCLSIFFFNSGT